MRVLVTGANGQLGYDVVQHLNELGIEHLGVDRNVLDITNQEAVSKILTSYGPDVVIHCAAYTAVDKAENDRENCYAVNVLGTRYIAEVCQNIDAKMVYISTDYVFDGEGIEPFKETDQPNPINYYGQTKYEGELEVQILLKKYYIVRISWVFGNHGSNFVKTMLRLGKEKKEVSVVCDQIGSPTYTPDLAKLLVEMIQTDKYGIYHATNEGYCSWYEFACEIFKQAGIDVIVHPVDSDDYPSITTRPKNSRLLKHKIADSNFQLLDNWKLSIIHFLKSIDDKGGTYE